MIFENGTLNPAALGPGNTAMEVIWKGCDRASGKVTVGDLLAALLESGNNLVLSVVSMALSQGVGSEDLLETVVALHPQSKRKGAFNGARDAFSPGALAALDEFDAGLSTRRGLSEEQTLCLLAAFSFTHLDKQDIELLTALDPVAAAQKFLSIADEQIETGDGGGLFDAATGALKNETVDEELLPIFERAASLAADLGYERILPAHLFLALLAEPRGVTETLVRRRCPAAVPLSQLKDTLQRGLGLQGRRTNPPPVGRAGFEEETLRMFGAAVSTARLWGDGIVEPSHLLLAILSGASDRLRLLLEQDGVGLRVRILVEDVERFLAENRGRKGEEERFLLPPELLPSEDWTWASRKQGYPTAVQIDHAVESLQRALYRKTRRHAFLTGPPGVGKTTTVRELARRAAGKEIAFLRKKRFVWVDASDVAPEQAFSKLQGLIGQVTSRDHLVVCVERLDLLLRGSTGGNYTTTLRTALKRGGWQLVGMLGDREFDDLVAGERELMDQLTQVKVAEADKAAARAMVEAALSDLAKKFGVRFDPAAVERAVTLSASYILNERLPAKAIKLLVEASEELGYEKSKGSGTADEIGPADIIRVVSRLTGVPEPTLAGTGDNVDYAASLGACVVGQPEAVKAVATELNLLKAGITRPGKPASVMFFAGLTGCGKTELAKTVARYYSASKRLQVYTMGNHTESHSVSSFIGSPPGYHGHDQGGRLVNDLLADPYGVFLLDEAEKAHPEVWRPFYNLFDEGWVVDQRGVKAFAERAIFILTSNEGHEIVARLSAQGASSEEILAAVKEHLTEVRHRQSQLRVFPPEFLARMSRILVFRPLNSQAMLEVCRKMVAETAARWQEIRQQEVVVSEELVRQLAEEGHLLNQQSNNKEGARILAHLIRDRVEERLRGDAVKEGEGPRPNVAELTLRNGAVQTRFYMRPPRTPQESVALAIHELRNGLPACSVSSGALERLVVRTLAGLEADSKYWVLGAENRPAAELLLKELREAREQMSGEWAALARAWQAKLGDLSNNSPKPEGIGK
jgi:ATP-dependent Clp protease ATP-binding subunit ClpA